MCVSEDGYLYSFGLNNNGQLGLGHTNTCNYPHKISNLTNIEFVICSHYHIICKSYNNKYYSWGDNTYGQLGQDNN